MKTKVVAKKRGGRTAKETAALTLASLEQALAHHEGKRKLPSRSYWIQPVPQFGSLEVQRFRQRTGLTQEAFGRVMGVSKKAVEAWENGTNVPMGPAQRLLGMLDRDGDVFLKAGLIVREQSGSKSTGHPSQKTQGRKSLQAAE